MAAAGGAGRARDRAEGRDLGQRLLRTGAPRRALFGRQAAESAPNASAPPAAQCMDVLGAFAWMDSCSGAECGGGVDYLAVVVGGADVACQMTLQELSNKYFQTPWCPTTFFVPASSTYIFELCPATCLKAGVPSVGCGAPPPGLSMPPMPPSPPPTPPLVPGRQGFITVATMSQLRELIGAAPPHSSLSLYLPPGAAFLLGGRPITISQIDLMLASGSKGAMLDAQQLSRIFVVQGGASLSLDGVVLANGRAETHGGTLQISHANVTMTNGARIANSTARLGGGAVHIGFGHLDLKNQSSIVGSRSSLKGGAIQCIWCNVMVTSRSSLVDSAGNADGGAIFAFHGDLLLMDGSLIMNSRAALCGALSLWSSAALLSGASIIGSMVPRIGGGFCLLGGIVTITNGSSIIDSAAALGGAGIVLTPFSAVTLSMGSSIVRGSAFNGGALNLAEGNFLMTSQSSLVDNFASGSGGALIVGGGSVNINDSSLIVNSSASAAGGAIAVTGGTSLITGRCVVINSFCDSGGGAIYVNGGALKISGACSIMNSTAGLGGALSIAGGQVILESSNISLSRAKSLGGAIVIDAGKLLITNGCYIVNSTASEGGGIGIYGGVATLANGSILSRSTSTTAGGAVFIQVGELHVLQSSIVGSTSGGEGGAIFFFSGFFNLVNSTIRSSFAAAGSILYFGGLSDYASDSLFLATHSEIQQQQCTSMFAFEKAMQIVLRNVRFTALEGCDQDLTNSSAFGNNIGRLTTTCGSVFINPITKATIQVCTPFAACFPQPVNGTLLSGVSCQCVAPDYVNPALDYGDAPYSEEGGCIRPWRMKDVFIISREIAITLHKPLDLAREVNLTLEMDGSLDAAAASWHLTGLTDEVSWLEVPVRSGAAVQERINILLKVSSQGLSERSTPYIVPMTLSVISGFSSLSRAQLVQVSLVVRAETSFFLWGHVPFRSLCLPDADTILTSVNASVDIPFTVPFTACDEDLLTVNHQLPTELNPYRPSVRLLAFGQEDLPMIVPYEYIGGGLYVIHPTLPTQGPFMLTLEFSGSISPLPGQSYCSEDFVPLPSGRCGCASGLFQSSKQSPCKPCPNVRTSSFEGAIGEGSCNICNSGYYRLASSECLDCPAHAVCPVNSSLETIQMQIGYWRLAPTASKIYRCDTWGDTAGSQLSACLGGVAGSNICAVGHSGPMCKVCTNQSQYFDDGRCKNCPESTLPVLSILFVMASLSAVSLALHRLHDFRGLKLTPPVRSLRLYVYHMKVYAERVGFVPKLKLFLSFSQIISALDVTFGIRFPESWTSWTSLFSVLGRINWIEWVAPVGCIFGPGIQTKLLIKGLAPLTVICMMPVVGASLRSLQRRADSNERRTSRMTQARNGACAWLPFSLFIAFCFTPSVSMSTFEAWNCIGFAVNDLEEQYVLESDLSVRCDYDSDTYTTVTLTSWCMIAVWPVGMVSLYAALLVPGRDLFYNEEVNSSYFRATAFLHRDYKKVYFWWEVCSLFERTLLTGWLLLIGREIRVLRISSALIICTVYLAALLLCQPFKRKLDNALAAVGQLTLICIFVFANTVLQYDLIENDPSGSSDLAQRFVGLHSAEEIVSVMIAIALSALVFFGGSLFVEWHSHFVSKQLERKWSLCSMEPPRVKLWKPSTIFACFITHYKMEAASDARYLHDVLRKMLRAPVFLDSVELNDLRNLISEGVLQSDVVLLLATKGVLARPWCLLELLEAVRHEIPIVIVQIMSSDFKIDEAIHFVEHLDEELQRTNPSGLEFLLDRLDGDLTELQKALLHILNDNNRQLSPFDSHASDYTLVAMIKDIVEKMGRKTNRSIEWETRSDTALHRPHPLKSLLPIIKFLAPTSQFYGSNASRRKSSSQVAVYITCARGDMYFSEARVLRSAISIKLDRACVIGGRDGSQKQLASSQLVVVMLTKGLLDDPDALLEVYLACINSIPLVTVIVIGSGYDFAEAAQLYSRLPHRLLEGGRPGLGSRLAEQLPEDLGLDIVGGTICHHLSHLIALPWTPNSSPNQLDALVNEIVSRMARRRASPSRSNILDRSISQSYRRDNPVSPDQLPTSRNQSRLTASSPSNPQSPLIRSPPQRATKWTGSDKNAECPCILGAPPSSASGESQAEISHFSICSDRPEQQALSTSSRQHL